MSIEATGGPRGQRPTLAAGETEEAKGRGKGHGLGNGGLPPGIEKKLNSDNPGIGNNPHVARLREDQAQAQAAAKEALDEAAEQEVDVENVQVPEQKPTEVAVKLPEADAPVRAPEVPPQPVETAHA